MRRLENWLGGWTLTSSIPLVTESIPFAGPFILGWIGADDLGWSLYYDKKKKNQEVQMAQRIGKIHDKPKHKTLVKGVASFEIKD